MQTIIDKLSENPQGRSLLKWLTAGLGLLTGYQMTGGFWGAILPAIATALVKRLEQQSSNAARAKLEQPINDPDDYDGEPLTPPDYSQIWKQAEAPTEKILNAETLNVHPISIGKTVEIDRRQAINLESLGLRPMPAIPAPSFPTPQEIEETEKLLESPPPTEFFVHWHDADDGAKVRKFTDKFSAIMFRNTKPGAVLK